MSTRMAIFVRTPPVQPVSDEMGIDQFGFADSLLCIIAQRLARRLCDRCKEEYIPDDVEWQELVHEYGTDDFATTGISRDKVKLFRKTGCDSCLSSGYKGRLGIHELLESSETIKTAIKNSESTDMVRLHAAKEGMVTLKQDGMLKVFQGLTDITPEVRRVCIK